MLTLSQYSASCIEGEAFFNEHSSSCKGRDQWWVWPLHYIPLPSGIRVKVCSSEAAVLMQAPHVIQNPGQSEIWITRGLHEELEDRAIGKKNVRKTCRIRPARCLWEGHKQHWAQQHSLLLPFPATGVQKHTALSRVYILGKGKDSKAN